MRPVDIAIDTRFNAFKLISTKYIDAVISNAAIIGIVTIIVTVTELIVDAQAITKLAVFTIRSIVAHIEIEAITRLLTQKISVFIKVGVNIIETVVVIVGSILVESAIQTDSEIVSLVVKLLGVVRSKMAEAGLRKGGIAHAIGQNAIHRLQIESLFFATAAETAVVIIEAPAIEGDVTRRVNFIVDVHENIAADATVVLFLGRSLVPH